MELENIQDAQDGGSGFLEGLEDPGEPVEAAGQDRASEDAPAAEPDAPAVPEAPPPPIAPPPPAVPLPPLWGGAPGGPGLPGRPASPQEVRAQADLRSFQQNFPEAARDPWSIPKEVWTMARSAGSLTAAYGAWSQALRRNADNAVRSAGSMRSAGAGYGPRDPFLEGWNE